MYRKLLVGLFIIFSFSGNSFAKTRVAISSFKDKTGSGRCRLAYWGNQLSSGFRDQISTAIMKTHKVTLVERENLKQMYSEEHELINANRATQPKRNQFKAAHFSITGAITQFEMCASEIGGKVDVGGLFGFKNTGLNVGGQRASAKVVLDMRIIDTETGEVVASFESQGESAKTGFDLDGDYKGADFSTGAFKASPIGKATQIAIYDAVKKILNAIPLDKKDAVQPNLSKQQSSSQKGRLVSQNHHRASSSSSRKPRKAIKASSRVSHVCQVLDEYNADYAACKVLSLSTSKTKARILNQYTGEIQVISTVKIYKISKQVAQPLIGSKYLLNSYDSGLRSDVNKNKKAFAECIISDAFENEYVFNCNGKEYSVSSDQLYMKLPLILRKTASR